jgi:hypothetical protein
MPKLKFARLILFSSAAVLMLALVACGSDKDGDVSTSAEPPPASGDEQPQDPPAPSDTNDGSGGTAVVVIGDERYETTSLNCDTDFGGADFAGVAEGPRPNARIHGRFATSLPDLVGVSFARGDEGEFRALAENELLPHGVLEDYEVDEEAGTMSGTAGFVWIPEGWKAPEDPDELHVGTFEIRC